MQKWIIKLKNIWKYIIKVFWSLICSRCLVAPPFLHCFNTGIRCQLTTNTLKYIARCLTSKYNGCKGSRRYLPHNTTNHTSSTLVFVLFTCHSNYSLCCFTKTLKRVQYRSVTLNYTQTNTIFFSRNKHNRIIVWIYT